MLRCRDNSYYIGVTSDVEVRLAQHARGMVLTCYTFERRPVTLVYSAAFRTAAEAIRWEKQIKGWSRAKKSALIRGDWDAIKTLARPAALRQAQDDGGVPEA
ncbi:MAG: GIY-YIG nuclease family protein [Candidatus Eremiobacteraeota bacterium]|nr:GIY-YIG nuclease family protein [Candidatus Eremiobacteraeota bacterium]